MTKQYPALQTDEAREYIGLIRKWADTTTVSLNRLIDDHERFVATTQFYEYSVRVLLFYLGGDITISKDVIDQYLANHNEDINVKARPQDDGSWRIWSVPEKDDPLPEDEQPES